MRLIIMLLAAVIALTACAKRQVERVAFDGVVFIPDVDRPKDDRASFTAAVKPVSGSFEGARAAAFYHGTRYCVQNYGTSHIKWTIGPDTPAEQLRIEKDSLAYQGRCYP